jgi:hypothetical protein
MLKWPASDKRSSLFLLFESDKEKETSGLYYKPITIVNDDSRVINKLETSLIDDARVIIYDHHVFIGHSYNYFFFISDIKAK